MTENQRRGVHFYVIFSETVKSAEYIVDMMMEKLSFDKRVEEWGYLNPEEVFDTIAEEGEINK